MTPRSLAQADCVSFNTVGEYGRKRSISRGRSALSSVLLLLQMRNLWINQKIGTHPQMVVLELSRAIWTEDADFRVIS